LTYIPPPKILLAFPNAKRVKPNNQILVERWIRWFEKDGDKFIDEVQLFNVNVEQLRLNFEPDQDDPELFYCYPITTEKQINFLSSLVKINFNFSNYEYFLECNAV